MKIQKNSVVTMDYLLKSETGELLDESTNDEPFIYLHGYGQLVPGLENALQGRKTGEKFSVTVAPADGYGERDEESIHDVPKADLAHIEGLEVGAILHASTEEGPSHLTVTALTDHAVTLDPNHPLAGQTLCFDIVIKEVREATEDELEQLNHHSGCSCTDH